MAAGSQSKSTDKLELVTEYIERLTDRIIGSGGRIEDAIDAIDVGWTNVELGPCDYMPCPTLNITFKDSAPQEDVHLTITDKEESE